MFEKGYMPKKVGVFPGCTYCQPQVASVGLTERAAKEAGRKFKVGKFPFMASGKARAVGEIDGFVKILFGEPHGEILGAHIIGAEATELIAELGLAIGMEATWEDIENTIHAHPDAQRSRARSHRRRLRPRDPHLMIQDRIEKIEEALRDAPKISPDTRQQLLALLADLKAEITPLTESHGDDAQSIASFADASVHEAVRSERKPVQASAAIEGLTASVQGFEASHPRLVEVVDRLAVTLSNMGI